MHAIARHCVPEAQTKRTILDMHPIAKAFARYWQRLRGERDVPRFLAGTSVVAAYGRDLTGVYMDELDTGGNYDHYVHNFNEVADERTVNRTADEYRLENGRLYRFDGHLYPFEGVRGDISRIIILAIDDWSARP